MKELIRSFSINVRNETWGEPRKYLNAYNRGCVRINSVLHGWVLLKAQNQKQETILILR